MSDAREFRGYINRRPHRQPVIPFPGSHPTSPLVECVLCNDSIGHIFDSKNPFPTQDRSQARCMIRPCGNNQDPCGDHSPGVDLSCTKQSHRDIEKEKKKKKKKKKKKEGKKKRNATSLPHLDHPLLRLVQIPVLRLFQIYCSVVSSIFRGRPSP